MFRISRFFLGVALLFSSIPAGATTTGQLTHSFEKLNDTNESNVVKIENVDISQIIIEEGVLMIQFGECLLPVICLMQSNEGYAIVARYEDIRCPNGHTRYCPSCRGCRVPSCGFCCRCRR